MPSTAVRLEAEAWFNIDWPPPDFARIIPATRRQRDKPSATFFIMLISNPELL
jgi:hypothetical protein